LTAQRMLQAVGRRCPCVVACHPTKMRGSRSAGYRPGRRPGAAGQHR
jgi:hypothetical protein